MEWIFGDILNYFPFIVFKKNLNIGLTPTGKMYIVCAILRNANSCLYQSRTLKSFGINLPQIQEYVSRKPFVYIKAYLLNKKSLLFPISDNFIITACAFRASQKYVRNRFKNKGILQVLCFFKKKSVGRVVRS